MAVLRASFDTLGPVAWSQHHKRRNPILLCGVIAVATWPVVLTFMKIENLLGSCRQISLDTTYDQYATCAMLHELQTVA